MREIKFRAWDIDKQEYITWFEIGCEGCVTTQEPNCSPDYPNVILEQYTGLKDKNGKEIYEGDILRLYDRFISPITWRETPVAFSWFANDGDGNCGLSKENEEYYEVIGNIHENQELVKEEE